MEDWHRASTSSLPAKSFPCRLRLSMSMRYIARMTSEPSLFDRSLQRRRLIRALRSETGYSDFLLSRVVEDLVDRLAAVKRNFNVMLDLGTPVPAVAAALSRLNPAGSVVRASPVSGPEGRGTVAADEELLPFARESFDLVASILAMQNVNDLPGAFVQVRRILKPDGLFLAAFFGGETLKELRAAFAQAESEIDGGISPRISPFVDLRDLGGLLQRAGFALPVADVDRVTVRYGSPLSLMRDLRGMGLTNTLTERSRRPLRRATLLRACEVYFERFADKDGRLPATFDILWLSGWAPHESQQKPLRPGSARTRLADVLQDRSLPPLPDHKA